MTALSRVFMLLMLVFAALTAAVLAQKPPMLYGEPGTNDFIEYWAAGRVAASGGNPYAPSALVVVEQQVGRSDSIPLMMWNPPWLLTIMRPVLATPFGVAAKWWMGLNALFVVLSAWLAVVGYRRKAFMSIEYVPALLGALISVPAVMTIQLGQVSALLLFGVATLYWALRMRHDVTAGVALALLSVKPHLFLALVALVAVMVLREQRVALLLSAFMVLGALVAITMRQSPSLIPDWWQSFVTPPAGAPAAVTWRTPNIPNVVREIIAHWKGTGPLWPLTAIPVASAIFCAVLLWYRPKAGELDEWFPSILCVSVIFAPFGWTFDHVVLSVIQSLVFVRAFTELDSAWRRWTLLGAVLACHLLMVMQSQRDNSDYFAFWWYPLVTLGIWLQSSAWVRASARR